MQLQLLLVLGALAGAGLTLIANAASNILAENRTRRVLADARDYERAWDTAPFDSYQPGTHITAPSRPSPTERDA